MTVRSILAHHPQTSAGGDPGIAPNMGVFRSRVAFGLVAIRLLGGVTAHGHNMEKIEEGSHMSDDPIVCAAILSIESGRREKKMRRMRWG